MRTRGCANNFNGEVYLKFEAFTEQELVRIFKNIRSDMSETG